MIYCVEDDDGIRELVIYTLTASGFEAKGFAGSAEFWTSLQNEKPELALLDIMLPGEDGISILKKLRRNYVTADIYNLCDNAIKYNVKGGNVGIQVTNAGDYAVLSVSDSGIGILPEEQERIFERFYRVDKSRSKEVGGTGLGLSIVKHAAAIHGAAIEVTSKIGSGTVFTIRFPKNATKE